MSLKVVPMPMDDYIFYQAAGGFYKFSFNAGIEQISAEEFSKGGNAP